MCKKSKIIFYGVICALIIACIIHTAISYLNISADKFTSFPAETAFYLIIPYVVAVLACVTIWLIIKYVKKK